jgi:predicted nuclease of predicted toxin-antitoxin system
VTVAALRAEGLDIVWVWEELSPLASDSEILDYARQEERTILTEDLDFSMLIALGGYDRPSLVTLRLSDGNPRNVADKILRAVRLLEQKLAEGFAITIDDQSVRLRKLPFR